MVLLTMPFTRNAAPSGKSKDWRVPGELSVLREKLWLPDCDPFVAMIVKLYVPIAVGTPLSTPVEGLSVSPLGNAPELDHANGPFPPAATNDTEKGVPTEGL